MSIHIHYSSKEELINDLSEHLNIRFSNHLSINELRNACCRFTNKEIMFYHVSHRHFCFILNNWRLINKRLHS